MDIKKELEFLKYISMGLFNKKHVRFELKTKPRDNGVRSVEINMRDNRFTLVGNNIDLYISYLTNKDTVYIKQTKGMEVSKEEAVAHIQEQISLKKEEYGSEYGDENDAFDFYSIIEQLSDQVFISQDFFELNAWRGTSLYLYKELELKYGTLEDAIHINGGVGAAKDMNGIHAITTSIEFGESPVDGKNYLGVFADIAESPKRPKGIYPDTTVDMFVETLLEQYQDAWNREGRDKKSGGLTHVLERFNKSPIVKVLVGDFKDYHGHVTNIDKANNKVSVEFLYPYEDTYTVIGSETYMPEEVLFVTVIEE